MNYDRAFFDGGIQRHGTACEKWDDEAMIARDDIALWVADMDFPCAEPIARAIAERAKHPCYGYTFQSEEDAGALLSFLQRRHGLTVKAEQTVMLPCVVTGLRACVRALTKPGDGVILQSPVYGPFRFSVEDNGRRVLDAPLTRDEHGRCHMDLAAVEAHLKAGARLMLLCSPHNPVSRLWSEGELDALLSLLMQYDAYLASDEIHADFVYAPARFTPILSRPGAEKRVISLVAASKTFNIAGLQQATVISFDDNLLKAVQRELRACGAVSGNIFALAATRAAYSECDAWLDALLKYLDEGREIVKSEIARLLPKAVLSPIEATYLAWLDLRAYGMTTEVMMQKAKARGVVLTSGTFFGDAAGEGFLRVNFGCPHAQLREGLKRLATAIKEG